MLDLNHEELGFSDLSKVDFDYEYDAPKFFDFTSPELQSEAEEVDRWFQYASGYMPSHRLWQKNKPKSPLRPYVPRSPTLMKPTASHLAKLCRPDGQSTTCVGRSPKPTSPLNHPREVCATKRQKLEIKKKQATHLRRQSSLTKKSSKLSMLGPLLHERKSAPCLLELQESHLRTLTRAAQAIR